MLLGLTDSSGLQFFYSKQPPSHMAGGLSFGYPITPDLVIPPGAVNFTIPAICSAACLERVCMKLSLALLFVSCVEENN